jgi:integrase
MASPNRKRPFVEKRGDRWRVRWPDANGDLRSATRDNDGMPFADKVAAEKYGWEQLGQAAPVEPAAPGGMTLNTWVNMWWPAQDLSRNTTSNYQWYIEAFILPEFGNRFLDTLTTLEIVAWENGIKKDYAVATAAAARSLLFTILGDAALDPNTGLKTNPAARPPRARGRRSGRVKRGRAAKKWPTPLEVVLAAERASVLSGRTLDFVMVVTFGWTGMRWAEVQGMQREFLRKEFYELDWQLPEVAGRLLREPLKSDSYRTHDPDDGVSRVDLPPFLHDLLQGVVDSHNGRCECEDRGRDCGGSGWVFLGPSGGHFRRSNYARRFWHPAWDGIYPARKRGDAEVPARPVLVDPHPWPGRILQAWPMAEPGLPYTPPAVGQGKGRARIPEGIPLASWLPVKKGIVPHGLRHGHNTWMEEDRIPRILQRERMGHREPGMGGRYTHVSDTMRAELMDALERRWLGALGARRDICPTSPVPLLQMLLDNIEGSTR